MRVLGGCSGSLEEACMSCRAGGGDRVGWGQALDYCAETTRLGRGHRVVSRCKLLSDVF